MGLSPHHIKSRGSGGLDIETNVVTLCLTCHDAAHHGYLVPGRRIAESKARKLRLLMYQGERMRDYLRAIVEEKYERL